MELRSRLTISFVEVQVCITTIEVPLSISIARSLVQRVYSTPCERQVTTMVDMVATRRQRPTFLEVKFPRKQFPF